MDDINKINKSSGSPENSKPKLPSRGYWLYMALFIILILFSIFSNPISNSKEIGWSEFEGTILSPHDVEKVIVVNKEVAEIYLKEDRLEDPKYKEISR